MPDWLPLSHEHLLRVIPKMPTYNPTQHNPLINPTQHNPLIHIHSHSHSFKYLQHPLFFSSTTATDTPTTRPSFLSSSSSLLLSSSIGRSVNRFLQGFEMVAQEFTVELDKPLVFQVGHLGEAYQEWVHQPIVSKEGPRFFKSDFWESLTRNEWYVIPIVWLPVVCWYTTKSFKMGHSPPQIALILLLGIFVWSLLEYTLHRFLFHIKTKSYWGNTLHYLLHGCHHKHPQDGLRLVFPPTATAILLVPFWNLVKLISTRSVAPALFAGGLLGYVMYDVTHYYLHHGQPRSEVPKNLKKYHLNHHFRIQNKGFGITSSLWDKVFGTLPQTKSLDKERMQ